MERRTKKALSLIVTVCLLLTSMMVFDLPQKAAADGPYNASNSTIRSANPTWTEIPNADMEVGTGVAAFVTTSTGIASAARMQTTAQSATFDNTPILQSYIDRTFMIGGGTVYIPPGQYRFNGSVILRKGVTIRGAWTKPVKGEPISTTTNTVFLVYQGKNGPQSAKEPAANANLPFIETTTGCAVTDITFYYPEQVPGTVTPFTPTISFGPSREGHWDCDNVNIRNVTLVNSFIGIQWNWISNGGTCPTVSGVYGSPLRSGVEIDNIVDVGRVENLNFSPDYWIYSGFNADVFNNANATTSETARKAVRDYIYNNGIAMTMRRNDWSYTCYLNIDGYKIGFRGAPTHSIGPEGNRTICCTPNPTCECPPERFTDDGPNGHNYGFKLTGCKYGIHLDKTNHVGIMFADIKITDCEYGIYNTDLNDFPVQVVNADISATKNAIYFGTGMLMMNGSLIRKGSVYIKGGTFNSVGNRFETPANTQVKLGPTARFFQTDNTYVNTFTAPNTTIYVETAAANSTTGNNFPANNHFQYTNIKAPEFPDELALPMAKGPTKSTVFTVSTARRLAFPGNDNSINHTTTTSTQDSTALIQTQLNAAAANGGGVVFLPPGKYRVDGPLTIPFGVELCGSTPEIGTFPRGMGSILEVFRGRGSTAGDPVIIMEERSGLRGITINYPEQRITDMAGTKLDAKQYPYAVQGRGSNIYVINVGFRATWDAMDFDTYKCDNLYVDFVAGHAFHNMIKYGNNGEGAIIKNIMCNIIVYGCGDESKFGTFNNGNRGQNGQNGHVGTHAMENLDFMVIGDSKNTLLYNNFHYSSKIGLHLINQGTGGPQGLIGVGNAIDAAVQTVNFGTGLTGTFNFFNTQIVAVGGSTYTDGAYMVSEGTNSEFRANFYNSDYWGWTYCGFVMKANSGIINLYGANIVDGTNGPNFLNLTNTPASSNTYTTSVLNFINSKQSSSPNAVTGGAGKARNISSLMNCTALTTRPLPATQITLLPITKTEANAVSQAGVITRPTTNGVTRASQNTGNAGNNSNSDNAIRYNAANYQWSTGRGQSAVTSTANQEWWMWNRGATSAFNTILMQHGGDSGQDWGMGANIYVSNTAAAFTTGTTGDPNHASWVEVASNIGNKQMIDVGAQTGQYIMIKRPPGAQSKGNWWGIRNVYVANYANPPAFAPAARYSVRQASYVGYKLTPLATYDNSVAANGTIRFTLDIHPDFVEQGYDVYLNGANNPANVIQKVSGQNYYEITGINADQVISVGKVQKKLIQTIEFPYKNAARNIEKGTSDNHAISVPGPGTGAITYTSANPSVATVNPTTGRITGVNVGTTAIIATKAQDTNYAGATAQYYLTVTADPLEEPPPIIIPPPVVHDITIRPAEGAATSLTEYMGSQAIKLVDSGTAWFNIYFDGAETGKVYDNVDIVFDAAGKRWVQFRTYDITNTILDHGGRWASGGDGWQGPGGDFFENDYYIIRNNDPGINAYEYTIRTAENLNGVVLNRVNGSAGIEINTGNGELYIRGIRLLIDGEIVAGWGSLEVDKCSVVLDYRGGSKPAPAPDYYSRDFRDQNGNEINFIVGGIPSGIYDVKFEIEYSVARDFQCEISYHTTNNSSRTNIHMTADGNAGVPQWAPVRDSADWDDWQTGSWTLENVYIGDLSKNSTSEHGWDFAFLPNNDAKDVNDGLVIRGVKVTIAGMTGVWGKVEGQPFRCDFQPGTNAQFTRTDGYYTLGNTPWAWMDNVLSALDIDPSIKGGDPYLRDTRVTIEYWSDDANPAIGFWKPKASGEDVLTYHQSDDECARAYVQGGWNQFTYTLADHPYHFRSVNEEIAFCELANKYIRGIRLEVGGVTAQWGVLLMPTALPKITLGWAPEQGRVLTDGQNQYIDMQDWNGVNINFSKNMHLPENTVLDDLKVEIQYNAGSRNNGQNYMQLQQPGGQGFCINSNLISKDTGWQLDTILDIKTGEYDFEGTPVTSYTVNKTGEEWDMRINGNIYYWICYIRVTVGGRVAEWGRMYEPNEGANRLGFNYNRDGGNSNDWKMENVSGVQTLRTASGANNVPQLGLFNNFGVIPSGTQKISCEVEYMKLNADSTLALGLKERGGMYEEADISGKPIDQWLRYAWDVDRSDYDGYSAGFDNPTGWNFLSLLELGAPKGMAVRYIKIYATESMDVYMEWGTRAPLPVYDDGNITIVTKNAVEDGALGQAEVIADGDREFLRLSGDNGVDISFAESMNIPAGATVYDMKVEIQYNRLEEAGGMNGYRIHDKDGQMFGKSGFPDWMQRNSGWQMATIFDTTGSYSFNGDRASEGIIRSFTVNSTHGLSDLRIDGQGTYLISYIKVTIGDAVAEWGGMYTPRQGANLLLLEYNRGAGASSWDNFKLDEIDGVPVFMTNRGANWPALPFYNIYEIIPKGNGNVTMEIEFMMTGAVLTSGNNDLCFAVQNAYADRSWDSSGVARNTWTTNKVWWVNNAYTEAVPVEYGHSWIGLKESEAAVGMAVRYIKVYATDTPDVYLKWGTSSTPKPGALVDPPTLVSKTSTSITVQSAAPGNGQTAEYAYSTTST
ncbi:MAG: Ig-like domain-containing protein, partial [Oscillospiraceae bacterium]|nr:Ig-like domain-containing protein [Oscillospiraceae bacterium]